MPCTASTVAITSIFTGMTDSNVARSAPGDAAATKSRLSPDSPRAKELSLPPTARWSMAPPWNCNHEIHIERRGKKDMQDQARTIDTATPLARVTNLHKRFTRGAETLDVLN